LFAAIYYWWPKMFGRMLDDTLGKIHFWLNFIGFNLAFGPMHILGLQGMPRRIYTYDRSLHLGFWNLVSTIGAFVIGIGVLVFLYNALVVSPKSPPAPADPWDARTLEWSIPSPPPEYNFAQIPTVHALDDYWHQKYTEDEDGHLVRLPAYERVRSASDSNVAREGQHIHMPSPSYFPLVASFGLLIVAYGMILGRTHGSNYLVSVAGLLVLLSGLYGWGLEPSAAPETEIPALEGQPALVGAGPPGRSLNPGAAGAESGSPSAPSQPAGTNGGTQAGHESGAGPSTEPGTTEGDNG
jgi:cytochrome c oxidase subunit 1